MEGSPANYAGPLSRAQVLAQSQTAGTESGPTAF